MMCSHDTFRCSHDSFRCSHDSFRCSHDTFRFFFSCTLILYGRVMQHFTRILRCACRAFLVPRIARAAQRLFCLKTENTGSFVFFVSISEKTKMGFASRKFSCFFFSGAGHLHSAPAFGLRSVPVPRAGEKKKLIFKNKAHFLFFSETATKKNKRTSLFFHFKKTVKTRKKREKNTDPRSLPIVAKNATVEEGYFV